MATTTNYGWTTPDDTALVKDGAAAIRTLGSSVDTTTKNLNPSTTLGDLEFRSSTSNVNTRLGIGSSGQHLTVVAGVPAWATASDQTPLTTKGDLFTFSTLDARLGVGANNTILTADSAEATGMKWATPAGGGKVLQVVAGTTSTQTTIASASFTDTALTATITPTLATSKILVILNQNVSINQSSNSSGVQIGALLKLFRASTAIWGSTGGSQHLYHQLGSNNAAFQIIANGAIVYLDSPATTSATTYKTQIAVEGSLTYNTIYCQPGSAASSIILMEIGA